MADRSKRIDETVVLRDENLSSGNIDEELIVDNILPRLPVNKIFQFKLVCKNWCNSISQDSFIVKYNSINNPTNCHSNSSFYYLADTDRLISSNDSRNQFKLPQPLCMFLKGIRKKKNKGIPSIRGSTNGLLYGLCDYGAGEKIFVCNPITKKVFYVDKPNDLRMLALAYDLHNNNGFDGFKIFGAFSIYHFEKWFRFEVYSSKIGKWHALNAPKLKAPPPPPFSHFYPPHFGCTLLSDYGFSRDSNFAYSKGKVYYYYSSMQTIMWFDVEEDTAGVVPCSDIEGNHLFVYPPTLGVCHEYGNGGEVSYSRVTVEGVIKIWLLKNGGGWNEFEWVIRHNVRLPVVPGWDCGNLSVIEGRIAEALFPLPYLGGEVLWFRVLYGTHNGKLLSVNTKSQELNYHALNCRSVWPFMIPTLLSCST
ncbi:hypothetical protein Sjap_015920 [Stephania japonica]|uniref:F-box domain-containing protein n=1 Tax=Stephania japonica TaxID=461633 RepID=A0AAP0IL57_9MAGN